MGDADVAVIAGSALPLQWPLVGRHLELDLFAATLGDDRAHGFVIHGPAGVGKTRLADQCMAVAVATGRFVARATASEGARSVPLGALAHLLPPAVADDRGDLVSVVAELRPVLLEQAANGPLVLFVDDLHLLDPTSATLVGQLVDADLVFLLATVRSDEVPAPGFDAIWQRARVRRIDLTDLDRAGIDTLLHLVLRGPVEAGTVSETWAASRGNVLFVRELVLGAVDTGHLVEQHGVWRLVGPLVSTPRLRELVATRLSGLDQKATEAVDRLAVWEPAGLATLEALVGFDVLERLDRAGVLSVRPDGRRQQVTLAHPLYGEIRREVMSPLTRRRLMLEHADRIDAHGSRRREDPVRVATARLDASGAADEQLLLRAARLARFGHDFVQVERLGRAAVAEGRSGEAGLLLGEALHELGAFAEADEVLTTAEAATTDEAVRVQVTEMRARNLMWGFHRPDEALAVNRAARDELEELDALRELTLNEAMLLTFSGRPSDALDVLAAVDPIDEPRHRALRAAAELQALVAVGRSETAAEAAARAFTEQSALPEQVALPGPGLHVITQIYALTEAGRLAEAETLATAAYELTPATAPPDARMWLSYQLGRLALVGGRLETARRWLGEARARSEQSQQRGPTRLVLSLFATASAGLDDVAAAVEASEELDALAPFPFAAPEQELGRAWSLAVRGDRPGARQVLVAGAELAAERGYRGGEAWLLHDIARLGDAESVVGRLGELAVECEGVLVESYAAHAAAVAARSPDAIVDAADRFEQLGACLLAAEAASEASQAFQRAGDRRASAGLGQRAMTLAAACEGARTPALASPVVIVPLTPRERDIAAFAAEGESSKAIAEHLHLSVRTVNNHLQNVYAKLGISGRRQLAAALRDATEPGEERQAAGPDRPGPRSSSSRP